MTPQLLKVYSIPGDTSDWNERGKEQGSGKSFQCAEHH